MPQAVQSRALQLTLVLAEPVFLQHDRGRVHHHNTRIPVDDPATHLELTMIHEVMILDHSGPDLAMLHYGAGLKLTVDAVAIPEVATNKPVAVARVGAAGKAWPT